MPAYGPLYTVFVPFGAGGSTCQHVYAPQWCQMRTVRVEKVASVLDFCHARARHDAHSAPAGLEFYFGTVDACKCGGLVLATLGVSCEL